MKAKRSNLIFIFSVIITAGLGVILNTTITCRISLFLLFLLCIIKGVQEKPIVNPFFLFSLVPFTLLIYSKISSYHLELTISTWIFAIINIAAFLLALCLIPPFRKTEKCIGVGSEKQEIWHIVILLFLSYMPTIYRAIFGSPFFLASVFYLFLYPALMIALKSKKKLVIGIIVAFVLISWISYVSKMSIFTFVLTLLIGYEKYYVDRPEKKKKVLIFTGVAIIIMILSFGFANQGRGAGSGFSGTTLEYYIKYGNVIWDKNARLFMPYMYLTTPWSNLQYVMQTQDTRTYGLWLLKPLLGYIQLDEQFADMYTLTPYSSFNTFTYLACCFKDFGYWASCFSSFILGAYTKKIYTRYKVSRSPLDVACYALVAQAVAEMFFSNHFFMQSYPFTIVVIMGIYKRVFCKGCSAETEVNTYDW